MAIDVRNEQIYNLRTLKRLLPRPVHEKTLKRWCGVGVLSRKKKRIKMECVRHGNEVCSSFEAYERFINKLGG